MITSVSNPKVKQVIQYQNKARARNADGVFVAEGKKLFLEAPAARIREVFASRTFFEQDGCGLKPDCPAVTVVEDAVFARMSDTRTPQGVLCIMEQFSYSLTPLLAKPAPLIAVLEDLQDPGNLGTIFRSGEGAGVDGVILTKGSVDVYNPKTVRSAMGSLFRVPFLYTDRLVETLRTLQQAGVTVYGAHLKGTACYDGFSYLGGTAFLIGNEGNGLSEEAADRADACLRIPMEGRVESLNASVAASLLLYEAYRQRRRGDREV